MFHHHYYRGCIYVSNAEFKVFHYLFLTVRLIGSVRDVYRGRVEVLYNGVWGRICFSGEWTITESNVVCRQLGYDGALSETYNGGGFDVEAGVIVFTNVECVGNENSILNCASRFRQ